MLIGALLLALKLACKNVNYYNKIILGYEKMNIIHSQVRNINCEKRGAMNKQKMWSCSNMVRNIHNSHRKYIGKERLMNMLLDSLLITV